VRINRDMLKTQARERRFFELCLETGQPCVIDNTNPPTGSRSSRRLRPEGSASSATSSTFR
jgi:hypothetical protein